MARLLSRRQLGAGAGALLATPAAAHHGFTGRYDLSRPIWLAGTVTAAAFAPPHPTLRLKVDTALNPDPPASLPAEIGTSPLARAEDGGQEREVELPPVSTFFELGRLLRPGDRVALIALRNCLPPHQLRSQWIRLADGRIVTRDGRMSTMVSGCEAR